MVPNIEISYKIDEHRENCQEIAQAKSKSEAHYCNHIRHLAWLSINEALTFKSSIPAPRSSFFKRQVYAAPSFPVSVLSSFAFLV